VWILLFCWWGTDEAASASVRTGRRTVAVTHWLSHLTPVSSCACRVVAECLRSALSCPDNCSQLSWRWLSALRTRMWKGRVSTYAVSWLAPKDGVLFQRWGEGTEGKERGREWGILAHTSGMSCKASRLSLALQRDPKVSQAVNIQPSHLSHLPISLTPVSSPSPLLQPPPVASFHTFSTLLLRDSASLPSPWEGPQHKHSPGHSCPTDSHSSQPACVYSAELTAGVFTWMCVI
jgi:hypothetical protein